MADKQISQLTEATGIQTSDLFVLEQSGVAKKLTGNTLISDLATALDGHGGISDISYTAPVAPSVNGTLTITLADGTVETFTVKNGTNGVDGTNGSDGVTFTPSVSSAGVISWTNDGGRSNPTSVNIKGPSGTNGTNGSNGVTFTPAVSDAGVISWSNDGGLPNPTSVNIKGDDGIDGESNYVWIKWAEDQPTADADMSDVPDAWMGVYNGTSSTAPTTYTSYSWYEVKGDTGAAGTNGTNGTNGIDGTPATLDSSSIVYQASSSGTVVPSGVWTAEVPLLTQGQYLWTRTTLTFNSGDPVVSYAVSRDGVDGEGAPSVEVPLADTTYGDVGTGTAFAREDHRHPLPVADDIVCDDTNSVQDNLDTMKTYEALYVTFSFSSSNRTYEDSRITADTYVASCTFDTPGNISGDITCTTSAGSLTLTGSVSSATTVRLILIKCNS